MQVERELYMGHYTLCVTETGERNPFGDENEVILNGIRVHGDVKEAMDITIPATITDIGSNVIEEASKKLVKSIKFETHKLDNENSIVHGVRTIADNAFNGCSTLKKVNFPETLCTIGKKAFTETGLKEIKIKHNVRIDKAAFESIDSLKKADISGLKKIPKSCFAHCKNLSEVKFSKKLKTIRKSAFEDTALKGPLDLTKYKRIKTVGNKAFKDTNISLVIVLPAYPENVGKNAYGNAAIEVDWGEHDNTSSIPSSEFEDFENEDPQWDDCR